MKRSQVKLSLRPNEITYLEKLHLKIRLEKWERKYQEDKSEYNLSMLKEVIKELNKK